MSKVKDTGFLDKTPALYSGGVLLNTLGFHVLRTLYLNVWRLKPKKLSNEYQKYADILDKDGILIIPDFLPAEQFEELKKEYEQLYSDWDPLKYDPEKMNKRQKDFPEYFETIAEKFVTPNTPAFTKYFLKNKLINELTHAVVHRKIRTIPYSHFWHLQRRNLDKNVSTLHTAAFPHADVPYPTVKVFLYLTDVDESNAAYIFAKGSHKLTWKRLMFEYKLSVRYAKTKNDIVTEEELNKLGYKSESISGKANTLFISNNMGYHNRGNFSNMNPRITAQLDYRNLESWRNTLNRGGSNIISRLSKKIVKSLDKSKKEKYRASISNNNMS
ncbi:MAG TPA: phytanoyl-CoA dioxygenase family protein [Ignavibacteria bacterium]|nr:phytanoyl-CoA dioxygenase family protein [Ignavibacteria bacterium]HRJ98482.1 phytanoyl-CoA dioxygenase family protein [Ignavibacteria bacterium]